MLSVVAGDRRACSATCPARSTPPPTASSAADVERGAQFTGRRPRRSRSRRPRQGGDRGGDGTTSPSTIVPRMLNETIGTRFKIVQGPDGRGGPRHERGEVEGMMSLESLQSARPDWLAEKKIHFIWQLALEAASGFPGGLALGQARRHAWRSRAQLRLIAGTADIGRSLVAPPACRRSGSPPAHGLRSDGG